MSMMSMWCCEAEGTQRGALLTVVCPYLGWLSQCGPGVGTVCPVVGMHGFGFRVCRFVWLVVVVRGDAGIRL